MVAMPYDLATCSYSRYRKDMGVPIRSTVGRPRQGVYEVSKSLTPYGIFGKYDTEPAYRVAYLKRLDANQDRIVAELNDLSDRYYGVRLVLLCYCDLRGPDGWCHRRMAAEWLTAQFGIEVPELSLPPRPRVDPQIALF